MKSKDDELNIYWVKCGRNGKNFGDWITSYIYQKITRKNAICAQKPITTKESFVKLINYSLYYFGLRSSNLKGKKKSFKIYLKFFTDLLKLIVKNQSDQTSNHKIIFGSGSILHNLTGWKNVTVWGSGIISSNDRFTEPKQVLCVRGPLTRKRFLELGYHCPEIYGDLGLLLPKFYQPKVIKIYKIGIIPHFVDFEIVKKMFAGISDIHVIDVCDDVEKVVDEICKCSITISSSLHGIIVSHAYNIPSCWATFSNGLFGDGSKFFDYYYSIKIDKVIEPIALINSDPLILTVENLENLIKNYPNPEFPINTEKLFQTIPF